MKSVLIITGASRGIGLATAEYFNEHDWHIINISRHPCPLPNVTNLFIDLSQADWAHHHQQSIIDALSSATRICLTHNAGVLFKDKVDALPESQLRTTLEVNIIAPALLNQIVLPLMHADSSIIYVGSTLSEHAAPNAASYIISKHAMVGLMRATCQDLYGRDITTACVCPGFTDTEMLRQHVGNIANITCTKRLITPHEIAETIYFCATHPVVNGAVLHANLGQFAG